MTQTVDNGDKNKIFTQVKIETVFSSYISIENDFITVLQQFKRYEKF